MDIRTPRLDSSTHLEVLSRLAGGLGFPSIHTGFEVQGVFSMTPDGTFNHEQKASPHGFRAVSDELVAEFRLDGLGVSRLEPYPRWDELRDHTRRLWSDYRAATSPERVTRLGLRYLNHVRLPYPISDLREYFLGLPDLPDEWPQTTSAFLFRHTLHDKTSGAVVDVTHALADDVDDDRIGVIFDIDTHIDGSFGVDDDSIWGVLEDMRDLKNRVFFGGVTEATLSLFE